MTSDVAKPSKKALKAVQRILDNLATSSFVDACGTKALIELKRYKIDMALDIDKEMK